MNLTFDKENDVAYLSFVEGNIPSVKQKAVEVSGSTLIVDVDADGAVIGIEFLGARKLLHHNYEPPEPQPIPPDLWGP